MNYYPARQRCRDCASFNMPKCKTLPFDQMPVHRRDGPDVIVKCNRYTPASP